MKTNDLIAISALVTLLLGGVAHAFVLPFLESRRMLDVPNHRSSHTKPTVRGGGLGIVAALIGGLALGVALVPLVGASLEAVIWFGATVVAYAALGWAEDSRGLTVLTRLGGQVVISVLASLGATALGGLPLGLAALAAVGGVFYVNTTNFMDGVNGISSWHGVVVGAFYAAIGFFSNSLGLMAVALVTAAAFLSFLPWNIPRARMFMGDVGSYALGASVWALCVWAVAVGTPLLVAMAPLFIYASDVVFTLLSRARRRVQLFEAHREHTYQRVHQITESHGVATAFTTGTTAACATIALLGMQIPEMSHWVLPIIGIVVLAYLATPPLLSRRLAFGKVEVKA